MLGEYVPWCADRDKELSIFRRLLASSSPGLPDFVLVPDTNALLRTADPVRYSSVIDSDSFRFVIVPTVLAELDGLKRKAKWQARAKLLTREFQWTQQRIFAKHPAHRATWWMAARTWSKSADAQRQSDTLAGLHAEYLLFLLDETGSMPRAIMATAEAALASGRVVKIVQAGNTTNPDGPLYDVRPSRPSGVTRRPIQGRPQAGAR